MNINEAIKKCCEEAGYKNCEECGVYGENECLDYLTKHLLDRCNLCGATYYYVNGNKIEKAMNKFCPECGRAL